MKSLFFCALLGLQVILSTAVHAPTWNYCRCNWNSWKSWSDCDSDCFGERVRIRSVRVLALPYCDNFNVCATDDEGKDRQTCNRVCHNGGWASRLSYRPCNCKPGFHGTCCTEVVNCGTPGYIIDGTRHWSSTNYGSVARYTCNTYYNMTTGDHVRTCQDDFTWSGTKPHCVFAYHCNSSPCKNGECVNLLDDFRCDCHNGWTGRLCENDIQPPVVVNCSSDIAINATERTIGFDWTPPSFYDPLGNDLDIVSNYPSPSFVFPWGDFTAQYVATKPSNGLSTECTFNIKVRPTPCEELNIPINGALICNGWKADYGQFCMVTCQQNYTIGPGDKSFETMYVCGASGTWIARGPIPDCQVEIETVGEVLQYQPDYDAYSFDGSCHNNDIVTSLQNLYIERIVSTSGFGELCTQFPDECVSDNVKVKCGGTI
ncbi:Sushi [Mactra antiquata]